MSRRIHQHFLRALWCLPKIKVKKLHCLHNLWRMILLPLSSPTITQKQLINRHKAIMYSNEEPEKNLLNCFVLNFPFGGFFVSRKISFEIWFLFSSFFLLKEKTQTNNNIFSQYKERPHLPFLYCKHNEVFPKHKKAILWLHECFSSENSLQTKLTSWFSSKC